MKFLVAFCLLIAVAFQTQAEPPELIPGILPEQVYLPLVELGFNKTGPETLEDDGFNHYRWELMAGDSKILGYRFYVKLWGTDYNNLYSIYVHAWQYPLSEDRAKEQVTTVMQIVSALDYPDATPHQAADWVVAHINDEYSKKVFAGVEYSISRTGTKWELRIAMPKPKVEGAYILN